MAQEPEGTVSAGGTIAASACFMASSPAISGREWFSTERLTCPVCHREAQGQYVAVTLDGRNDRYCLYCYADWIDAHLPKLVPVATTEKP